MASTLAALLPSERAGTRQQQQQPGMALDAPHEPPLPSPKVEHGASGSSSVGGLGGASAGGYETLGSSRESSGAPPDAAPLDPEACACCSCSTQRCMSWWFRRPCACTAAAYPTPRAS